MTRPLLITGFGPFGSVSDNPSAVIARHLDGTVCGRCRVVGVVLPVEIETLEERLAALIDRFRPAAVVQFGVAESRDRLILERVAVNQAGFTIPDITGVSWRDRALVERGPPTREATLPLRAIAECWSDARLPYAWSDDAGRYLCNAALYFGLAIAHRQAPEIPWGFIHVPLPREENPASLLSIADLHRAAALAVEATESLLPSTEIA